MGKEESSAHLAKIHHSWDKKHEELANVKTKMSEAYGERKKKKERNKSDQGRCRGKLDNLMHDQVLPDLIRPGQIKINNYKGRPVPFRPSLTRFWPIQISNRGA